MAAYMAVVVKLTKEFQGAIAPVELAENSDFVLCRSAVQRRFASNELYSDVRFVVFVILALDHLAIGSRTQELHYHIAPARKGLLFVNRRTCAQLRTPSGLSLACTRESTNETKRATSMRADRSALGSVRLRPHRDARWWRLQTACLKRWI